MGDLELRNEGAILTTFARFAPWDWWRTEELGWRCGSTLETALNRDGAVTDFDVEAGEFVAFL